MSACATQAPVIPLVAGTVWQIHADNLDPRGGWDRIGAHELLVQWTAVDGTAFVAGGGPHEAAVLPDWARIAGEPWARDVILGLEGRFDERAARADVAALAASSERLATLPTPLHVTGWYFPVEIDPGWREAPALVPLLARLPRPLWISVYDSANVGPTAMVDGLVAWLPADVGVFFQDGVGVHAREAGVARRYADAMAARLGSSRVRIIAEAFRPRPGGGFRAATIAELAPQLTSYEGYRVYLFEGPHYVSDKLVGEIRARQRAPGARP